MSGRDGMWARVSGMAAGAALLALLAGCAVPEKAAPAAPPPRVPAPPQPVPPPPPPPGTKEWPDIALTPGDWTYASDPSGSQAAFGASAAAPAFLLRCEAQRREILLSRPAAVAAALVVRTSYGARTLANPRIPASDALLDEIAFSRGRFTVESPGLPTLVIPAWAEPARVVEDCRG